MDVDVCMKTMEEDFTAVALKWLVASMEFVQVVIWMLF